jgi:GNAT superfamily N-acetyltransferase
MTQDADPVEAAERNYFAAWKLLVDRAPGGLVEETDEVLLTFVPKGVAYFNSAFVKPPADPATCLAMIQDFYRERRAPFTVRFRSSTDPDALSRAPGLTPAGRSPLMNATIDDIAPPADTDIKRVDVENWDDHIQAIAAGFGMPVQLTVRLFHPALVEAPEYAAFNAYIDGEVASTAALIVSDVVAGVYNVATPEGFRRRGLGEATTRAAIAEGRHRGCVMSTLQASNMGYPIYERMGFRTAVTWTNLTGS